MANLSNYPGGFSNGVTIQNLPVLNTYSRKAFWVHSGTGSNGNKGTFDKPFATIDYAIGFCNASRNDLIMVKAGHAETITAAAGFVADIAGVSIIGLGTGRNRPALTFTTAAGADVDLDAANVLVKNIRFVCGVDSQTAIVDVNAAGCVIEDCVFDESSATGLTCIDINGGGANACDRTIVRGCKFYCTTAANWDRAIELGEVADRVEITDNIIVGDFDDAAIHNPTGKVLTNLLIARNYVRNNQAGQHAIELVSACTGTAFDNVLVTDAQLTAFDAGALSAVNNRWNLTTGGDTEGVAVNPTSEMTPRLATKAIAAAGTSLTTGLSPVTLFTVTGDVLCSVVAVVTTALASTLNNGTLAIGVSGATGGLIAATTADGTNFATNTVWAGDTSPTLLGEVLSSAALNYFLIGNGQDIICTIATNSMTAGAITFYCRWIPLSAGAMVVGA